MCASIWRKMVSKCSLIHDNKRLAISNNIGVKLVSTQDHMTISEESTSKREVAI